MDHSGRLQAHFYRHLRLAQRQASCSYTDLDRYHHTECWYANLGLRHGRKFSIDRKRIAGILALQAQFQAASPLDLQQTNPAYAQQYLNGTAGGVNYNCQDRTAQCFFAPGTSMFNPNYQSPRSVVMNIGIQRELHPGMVLSVDYIRNVQTHFLLGVDQNHAGDITTYNPTGANAAIAATITNCGDGSERGCRNIPEQLCQGSVQRNKRWRNLRDGREPCPHRNHCRLRRKRPRLFQPILGAASCFAALGHPCAFGGRNPAAPPLTFLSPVGRSVYNGLQMKWIDNVKAPFRGSKDMNFQVSYALSQLR